MHQVKEHAPEKKMNRIRTPMAPLPPAPLSPLGRGGYPPGGVTRRLRRRVTPPNFLPLPWKGRG